MGPPGPVDNSDLLQEVQNDSKSSPRFYLVKDSKGMQATPTTSHACIYIPPLNASFNCTKHLLNASYIPSCVFVCVCVCVCVREGREEREGGKNERETVCVLIKLYIPLSSIHRFFCLPQTIMAHMELYY